MKSCVLALLVAGPLAAPPPHFDVTASFVAPAKPGGNGSIAVRLAAHDPDVNVNEEPAPRLRLDPAQKVLVDKQSPPPSRTPVFDPESVRYLDLERPVLFPVAFASGAPKGAQVVKATVVYFYCSKREGWCRRGQQEVEVAVTVR